MNTSRNPAWNPKMVELHCQAADKLLAIKDEAFAYLGSHPSATEYDLQQHVINQFKAHGLVCSLLDQLIVGFDGNAAIPHYFPAKETAQVGKPGSIVLIDIWGKLPLPHAPYADITWVGTVGPSAADPEAEATAALVFKARDAAVSCLEEALSARRLPTGAEVDEAAAVVLRGAGLAGRMLHRTGHSIGFTSPHGIWSNVNSSNPHPLRQNLGYTIEPGAYFHERFGIRSEIDFYITDDYQLVITTKQQQSLATISPGQ